MISLIDSIHEAAKQHFWLICMQCTAELLKEGKVVKWALEQHSNLDYAEWIAGEPMSWRAQHTCRVSWRVWTMPSKVRRVGNSWTGGAVSQINEGGYVTVTPEQAQKFITAIQTIQ